MNGTEVDLIGPNRNFLGRTNYLQQILEKKLFIILQYKIIVYSHASRKSTTSYR